MPRFCNLFVPGALVITLLGTLQPVRGAFYNMEDWEFWKVMIVSQAVNAYCLLLLAIPSIYMLVHQVCLCSGPSVYSVYYLFTQYMVYQLSPIFQLHIWLHKNFKVFEIDSY